MHVPITVIEDGDFRYSLTHQFDENNEDKALWILLNPPPSAMEDTDETFEKCVDFTTQLGMGGVILVSLFAFREDDLDTLLLEPDPIGPVNDSNIITAFNETNVSIIIAAWGSNGAHLGRGPDVVRLFREQLGTNHRVQCLGVTKNGHPRHPLLLPLDTRFARFEKHLSDSAAP